LRSVIFDRARCGRRVLVRLASHTNQIAFDAKHKRIWVSADGSQCQVVDVSRPTRPRLAARYGEPGDKLGVWGVTVAGDVAYLSYINAILPFRGTWAGIKAVRQ